MTATLAKDLSTLKQALAREETVLHNSEAESKQRDADLLRLDEQDEQVLTQLRDEEEGLKKAKEQRVVKETRYKQVEERKERVELKRKREEIRVKQDQLVAKKKTDEAKKQRKAEAIESHKTALAKIQSQRKHEEAVLLTLDELLKDTVDEVRKVKDDDDDKDDEDKYEARDDDADNDDIDDADDEPKDDVEDNDDEDYVDQEEEDGKLQLRAYLLENVVAIAKNAGRVDDCCYFKITPPGSGAMRFPWRVLSKNVFHQALTFEERAKLPHHDFPDDMWGVELPDLPGFNCDGKPYGNATANKKRKLSKTQ
jgi:hypothetical protein